MLANLEGPGTVTHVWMTVGGPMPDPGEHFLRRQLLEVFYGDGDQPSVSVPMPDFFGAVHGVTVPYASALTAVNEGRGFASRIPMPFRDRIRVEYTNGSDDLAVLYYQVDALLGPLPDDVVVLQPSAARTRRRRAAISS